MLRLRYMHDLYLDLLTLTGMLLGIIPALSWPNALTILSGLISIAVGLSTFWLRRRQHRTQSRIERILEEERLKEAEIADLRRRLARYEQD